MENENFYNQTKNIQEDNFSYDEDKKSKNKLFKIFIFIIFGILILSGVGYAGYWGYNKYFSQTPEKILMKSFQKMQNVKALGYEGKVSISMPIDPVEQSNNLPGDNMDLFGSLFSGNELDASLVFVGTFDHSDLDNTKSKLDIDLSVGDMFTFGAQMVSLNDTIYFNLNKIPVMLAMFIDLSSVKDQWIKYEFNKPLETSLDLPEINQDKEELKKIVEVIGDNFYKIIIIKEDLGAEEISDVEGKVYHYKLGLDKNGIEKITEYIKLVVSEERQKSIDDALENIKDKDWQKITQGEVDVWIGKKDYYLKKIGFVTNFDNSSILGQNNMRDPERMLDIKDIQTALGLYFEEKGSYPVSNEPLNLGRGKIRGLCTSEIAFYSNEFAGCTGDADYEGFFLTGPADSDYFYQSIDGASYSIDFMVYSDIEDFKQGMLSANPSGITQKTITKTERDDDFSNDVKLSMGILFKDFNQQVTVEIPEESIKAEQFLQNIMTGMVGGLFKNEVLPELKGDDKNSFDSPEFLDSDGDSLTDKEEIEVWQTDPTNPDTDNDGYLDGQEVQNGYNPNGEGKLE